MSFRWTACDYWNVYIVKFVLCPDGNNLMFKELFTDVMIRQDHSELHCIIDYECDESSFAFVRSKRMVLYPLLLSIFVFLLVFLDAPRRFGNSYITDYSGKSPDYCGKVLTIIIFYIFCLILKDWSHATRRTVDFDMYCVISKLSALYLLYYFFTLSIFK